MKHRTIWNRRDFIQLAGSASLAAVGTHASWLAAETKPSASIRFAYAGYAADNKARLSADQPSHGIQVFAVKGNRWTPTQTVASTSPVFLALDPTQQFLYAVSNKDIHEGLPTGAIEAYSINARDGSLTLLNRQSLSLSGVRPRHLAVAPDGRSVVIAIDGGGAYNVLPVGKDGRLERVSGILKETGSGPNQEHQDAAHPQMVMFDTTGRHVLSADMGSDRLSVFQLGVDGPVVHDSIAAEAGSGPRQMAMHPSGHLLFVANDLNASLSCYGYDAASGKLLDRLQHVSASQKDLRQQQGVGSLLMHPSGRFLYTLGESNGTSGNTTDITAWNVDKTTGAMRRVHTQSGLSSVHGMAMVADGSSLLLLDKDRNGISQMKIDSSSGRLGEPLRVASIASPISLTTKYL
jgi:6-phosphogluconolactonase